MLKLPERDKKIVKKASLSHYKLLLETVKRRQKEQPSENVERIRIELPKEQPKALQGAINLEKVSMFFGKHKVLDNINLTIKPGKIFGIIGVSGSGKTTILRLIIGYYKPTQGKILFNNEIIGKNSPIKGRFGFASQDNSFYHNLNAEENLYYFGKLYGVQEEYLQHNINRVIQLVELNEARKTVANHLSGGMQRRLDFACSLINNPSVLILDEPTEDLDPHLRIELLKLIKEVNKRGTTVIFTTHLLNEAEYLCDEVAIIDNGAVLEVGTPDQLKDTYMRGSEIHLILKSGKYEDYIKLTKGSKAKRSGSKLILYTQENDKAIDILKRIITRAKQRKDEIILADIKKPSLTEVFNTITKNVAKKKRND